MKRLKGIAIGVVAGLLVTAIAFPVLGLLVDTDLSFLAKTLMLILVPGIVITTRDVFAGIDHAVLYLILVAAQVTYWALLSALWLWWRESKTDKGSN